MKKTILLIDDDEDEFELFIEALRETDFSYDCIFTKDAEQALNLLHYTVPDFIFLDYNMPRINGLQCLREIKKIESMQDVPVILYSTAISKELTENAITNGAALCIKKPYNLSMLAEILKSVLAMPLAIQNVFYYPDESAKNN
jgi:CheY-like chemotaxis protein